MAWSQSNMIIPALFLPDAEQFDILLVKYELGSIAQCKMFSRFSSSLYKIKSFTF